MSLGKARRVRSRIVGVLFSAAAALGCAGSQEKPAQASDAKDAKIENGPPWSVRSTRCDASAKMPAPVKERQLREGPVMARVAWSVDEDGSRYEIACFDGPELTTESDRAGLVAMIEDRIGNTPGIRITGRQRAHRAHLEALELEVAFPEDRIGRYWIFLVEGRRLFEVSVVGPSGERLVEGSERFFGSFQLTPNSTPR
ncbi:MAG TPA: hypothetical protein VE093_25690 [Polyangiaceae bacterium]|nr:hypothetical protein [Polyangiaceae bacterium]